MNKLVEFIKANHDEMLITGGITNEQIHELEKQLDLTFCAIYESCYLHMDYLWDMA